MNFHGQEFFLLWPIVTLYPGEKVLKRLYESYNKALTFHRQMAQDARQQQRPGLDKNALNELSYQFLEDTKTLLEPIRQSIRFHADALESLSRIDIYSHEVDKTEAERLLLILIKECEQLSSMSTRLIEGNDALTETYRLRKEVIETLIKTGATKVSEETIVRQRLEADRKKMSSSDRTKK